MNVILCEDVDNLGAMGDQVKVKPGYARNFLLPRRLAVVADSASAQQIEHELRIIKKREDKLRVELEGVAKTLADVRVEFSAKAGAEGKLFGSITTLHIAQQLKELGYEVTRKKIKLAEPIKTAGEHVVMAALGAGVEATIKVVVTAEEVIAEEQTDDFVDTDDDDEGATMAMAEAQAPVKPKAKAPAAEAEAPAAEAEAPAEEASDEAVETPAEDAEEKPAE